MFNTQETEIFSPLVKCELGKPTLGLIKKTGSHQRVCYHADGQVFSSDPPYPSRHVTCHHPRAFPERGWGDLLHADVNSMGPCRFGISKSRILLDFIVFIDV